MTITLIAAMAKRRVIGKGNEMPWHMPADLRHFRCLTQGKPIIMGRKTFDSIGRPLPKRQNVVVTRQADWSVPNVAVCRSLEQALALFRGDTEVMVIGGASIYQQALPLADKMYLTYIDLDVEGDAFFPEWDEQVWKLVDQQAFEPDEENAHAYQFLEYCRMDFSSST